MSTGARPEITVVVPTAGRRTEIVQTLEHVAAQTTPPASIVVVVDGDDATTSRVREAVGHVLPRPQVLSTGGGLGAHAARHLGVEAAATEWVALLDDDDLWDPTKLERQGDAALARSGRGRTDVMISCLCAVTDASGVDRVLPRTVPTEGQPIGNYLFCRGIERWGDAFLQSSTFLLPTQLARRCIRPAVRQHQDWDLALRVEQEGASIEFVNAPLVSIALAPQGGMTRTSTWRASVEWVREWYDHLSPEAVHGFLLINTASRLGWRDKPRALPVLLRESRSVGRISFTTASLFLAMATTTSGSRARIVGMFKRVLQRP